MDFAENERLSAKIVKFLKNRCPAFVQVERYGAPFGGAGAVWHGCKCTAQGGDEPCDCVWHVQAECDFGTWDMPFITEAQDKQAKIRAAAAAEMAAFRDPAFTPAKGARR